MTRGELKFVPETCFRRIGCGMHASHAMDNGAPGASHACAAASLVGSGPCHQSASSNVSVAQASLKPTIVGIEAILACSATIWMEAVLFVAWPRAGGFPRRSSNKAMPKKAIDICASFLRRHRRSISLKRAICAAVAAPIVMFPWHMRPRKRQFDQLRGRESSGLSKLSRHK